VAAPTFGAEGADGRAPVAKAQEGRGQKTLARDIASGVLTVNSCIKVRL
jgi:hypothetical protein